MAETNPFPPAPAGQKRYMIRLDPKDNEDDFKVLLVPGRIEKVDGANRHMMGGKIEEKTLQGWGYNYYEVTLGPVAGTMMMPMGPAAEKKDRFVGMYNENYIRYNSKLPIVVYTPENCVLKYKIWGVVKGDGDGLDAKAE